jgi:hypothetical protein
LLMDLPCMRQSEGEDQRQRRMNKIRPRDGRQRMMVTISFNPKRGMVTMIVSFETGGFCTLCSKRRLAVRMILAIRGGHEILT